MKRYRQFEPVIIADFEVSRWKHPHHNHNHYELIYIKQGSGKHYVNDVNIDYKSGDVFLLGPEESHYFVIAKRTRFIYVKFTDLYIHQKGNTNMQHIASLEYLIKSRETYQTGFTFTEVDQNIVDNIFGVIISLQADVLQNEALIWMQVIALSIVLQRNMPELKAVQHNNKDMQAIFCYIHKFIYAPDNLKAMAMSKYFHMAPGYLGPYFKRNTGYSLRSYIRDYRLSLMQKRVESGNYSLKQIAAEFSLVDGSHVSKLLKMKLS